MKLLYLGDIVGRSGREAVTGHLPELRRRYDLDFVVANGENAAGGFGITGKICEEFYALGVDVITTGNHVWDQKETYAYIEGDPRLLRPQNYPRGTPGRGAATFKTAKGKRVAIIHVMGRVFMDPLDDPFACVAAEMAKLALGGNVDAILVDVHGEATSEKMAMGHFVDGRATMVVGSHSHVPTADAQVLPGGTAFQTDAGMCGDYNSVIGMDKAEPLNRFLRKIPGGRFEPASGEATLCGVLVESDDKTGLALAIDPVRIGGRLKPTLPGGN
ncbi:MAG TPA: TIGR00282 family metallophosphoesterase [Candidatus Cybelea sp.]|nr:TIGR00282 family metallophosphoesterase [Candidatus Cybelea sp.]